MPTDKSAEAILKRAKAFVETGAGSANKNEAREAAVKACKLIKEHGLLEPAAAMRTPIDIQATVKDVREAMADPNVAATISAGADLLGKAADLWKGRRRSS